MPQEQTWRKGAGYEMLQNLCLEGKITEKHAEEIVFFVESELAKAERRGYDSARLESTLKEHHE